MSIESFKSAIARFFRKSPVQPESPEMDDFNADDWCGVIPAEEGEIPEPTDSVRVWAEIDGTSAFHLMIPDWDELGDMPIFDAFESGITNVGRVLSDGDYPGMIDLSGSGEEVECAVFVRNDGNVVKFFIAA